MEEYTRSGLQRKRELRRRRIRRRKIKRACFVLAVLITLCGVIAAGTALWRHFSERTDESSTRGISAAGLTVPDYVDVQLIPKGNARTGQTLSRVRSIVIHYVGNPGTTAQNNRDYFAKEDTEVCSHFVVGLEGEIIQCVPLGERSAASNSRNKDSISIEVCHPDASGKFSEQTYTALVRLTAWLCENLSLSEEDVIRHYDVTGKLCPLYYVENPSAWDVFRADVKKQIEEVKA